MLLEAIEVTTPDRLVITPYTYSGQDPYDNQYNFTFARNGVVQYFNRGFGANSDDRGSASGNSSYPEAGIGDSGTVIIRFYKAYGIDTPSSLNGNSNSSVEIELLNDHSFNLLQGISLYAFPSPIFSLNGCKIQLLNSFNTIITESSVIDVNTMIDTNNYKKMNYIFFGDASSSIAYDTTIDSFYSALDDYYFNGVFLSKIGLFGILDSNIYNENLSINFIAPTRYDLVDTSSYSSFQYVNIIRNSLNSVYSNLPGKIYVDSVQLWNDNINLISSNISDIKYYNSGGIEIPADNSNNSISGLNTLFTPEEHGEIWIYTVDTKTVRKYENGAWVDISSSVTQTNTFTLTDDVMCDFLVVGGGGSCGNSRGPDTDAANNGAGGAGGLHYYTNKKLPYGSYTVHVGSGGDNNDGEHSYMAHNTNPIWFNDVQLRSSDYALVGEGGGRGGNAGEVGSRNGRTGSGGGGGQNSSGGSASTTTNTGDYHPGSTNSGGEHSAGGGGGGAGSAPGTYEGGGGVVSSITGEFLVYGQGGTGASRGYRKNNSGPAGYNTIHIFRSRSL